MMNPFKRKTKEDLQKSIIDGIRELGDLGSSEAIRGNEVPAKLVIDRLDSVRNLTHSKGMTFAETEASTQIDRIRSYL